jgi:hypothetical protein
MSHYLCTTRSGLFLNFTKKILNGAFFGLARNGIDWYIFGSKADDRSKPTNEGFILKFTMDFYGNPVILEEFASGLDNGVHQIMVHDEHLYVLETYIQQIRTYLSFDKKGGDYLPFAQGNHCVVQVPRNGGIFRTLRTHECHDCSG